VCFAGSADVAIVALLDGSVLALKVNKQAAGAAVSQQQQQQAQQGAVRGGSSSQLVKHRVFTADEQQVQQLEEQLLLSVHWQYKGAAPIFSSPVVDEAAGLVLVAAVDGTVCGLRISTGQEMWRVNVQSHVFADLLLRDGRRQGGPTAAPAAQAAAAAAADVGRAAEAAANHDVGVSCVVAATQGGWVVGLNSRSGQKVRQANRWCKPEGARGCLLEPIQYCCS
jgi:outer membrane protein assembly factor BamB